MRILFENLKIRIKLNIIKYNKQILNKLNLSKIDFEDFNILKDFNHKFNLDIRDIDIKYFDIKDKKFGNEILKYLKKLRFNELRSLILDNIEITDINELTNIKCKKLELLSLINNKISDINIFENVNFKDLK